MSAKKQEKWNGSEEYLYDRKAGYRYEKKEYADKEFRRFLDLFSSDCEILETSYGFYTSEPPTYIVAYKYSNGINDNLAYAYKISVDDKQVCTILEEGVRFLIGLYEFQLIYSLGSEAGRTITCLRPDLYSDS